MVILFVLGIVLAIIFCTRQSVSDGKKARYAGNFKAAQASLEAERKAYTSRFAASVREFNDINENISDLFPYSERRELMATFPHYELYKDEKFLSLPPGWASRIYLARQGKVPPGDFSRGISCWYNNTTKDRMKLVDTILYYDKLMQAHGAEPLLCKHDTSDTCLVTNLPEYFCGGKLFWWSNRQFALMSSYNTAGQSCPLY